MFPDAIEKAIQTHGELPPDLSADERRAVETLTNAYGYVGQALMAYHPHAVRNVTVPVAVSVFPDDVVYSPRSWTEQAYPNLVHYKEIDRGGHFAAWEVPELYASELREGFRSLR